jgi:hypothetical protein
MLKHRVRKGSLLVKAAVLVNFVGTGFQAEQGNAQEGPQVHDQVDQQIEDQAGVACFCAHHQAIKTKPACPMEE